MIKKTLKTLWRVAMPASYWRHQLARLRAGQHEPELRLLPALADRQRRSVDVGAAGGSFVAHLYDISLDVLAFEPRPRQAADLLAMSQALQLPVSVETVALSDRAGTARLRMLVHDLGRSTIDAGNALDDPDGSPRAELQVPMKRLDDYALQDLGLLKIDVEGHELAVLAGAQATLLRSRCPVLIETEDRHHAGATAAVFAWMAERGYAGFFLLDSRLTPVLAFDRALHQDERHIGGWRDGWARRGIYVNNFIFVPQDRVAAFLAAAAGLGFAAAA